MPILARCPRPCHVPCTPDAVGLQPSTLVCMHRSWGAAGGEGLEQDLSKCFLNKGLKLAEESSRERSEHFPKGNSIDNRSLFLLNILPLSDACLCVCSWGLHCPCLSEWFLHRKELVKDKVLGSSQNTSYLKGLWEIYETGGAHEWTLGHLQLPWGVMKNLGIYPYIRVCVI